MSAGEENDDHGTPPPLSAGKIVVLTGATRGLGRSLALRLAELGNTVLACGRSPAAISGPSRTVCPRQPSLAICRVSTPLAKFAEMPSRSASDGRVKARVKPP